uniref:Uncharacterized protein n=1 Tax=Palpitomonas bilix TaxID=652834 RepID=A0A7S3GB41_9EUKA|mmetsp:Transcript_34983/g.90623  ORF Transcript_34983/g.90623 Transcript_34983/m.90623 type:complete len:1264 (+) Transcript_34983:73-3864(+)
MLSSLSRADSVSSESGDMTSNMSGMIGLAEGIENNLGGLVNDDGASPAIPWYAVCEELRMQLSTITKDAKQRIQDLERRAEAKDEEIKRQDMFIKRLQDDLSKVQDEKIRLMNAIQDNEEAAAMSLGVGSSDPQAGGRRMSRRNSRVGLDRRGSVTSVQGGGQAPTERRGGRRRSVSSNSEMGYDDHGRRQRRGSLSNISQQGSSSKVTDNTLAMAQAAAEAKARAKALQAARAEAAAEAEAQAKAIAEAQSQAVIAQKDLEIAELRGAISQMVDREAYTDLSARLEIWQRSMLAMMERLFKDATSRCTSLVPTFAGALSTNLSRLLVRDSSNEMETKRLLLDVGGDGILLRWLQHHVPDLLDMLVFTASEEEQAMKGARRALRMGMGIRLDDDSVMENKEEQRHLPETITDGLLRNEEIYVVLLRKLRASITKTNESLSTAGTTKDESEKVALEASFEESLNFRVGGQQMDALEKAKRLVGAVATLSGLLPQTAMAGEGLNPTLRGCIPSLVERVISTTQDFILSTDEGGGAGEGAAGYLEGVSARKVPSRDVLKRVANTITADDLAKGKNSAHRLLLFSLFVACPSLEDGGAIKQIDAIHDIVRSLNQLYEMMEQCVIDGNEILYSDLPSTVVEGNSGSDTSENGDNSTPASARSDGSSSSTSAQSDVSEDKSAEEVALEYTEKQLSSIHQALSKLEGRAVEDGRWWSACSSHITSSAVALGAEAWVKRQSYEEEEEVHHSGMDVSNLATLPAAVARIEGTPMGVGGGKKGKGRARAATLDKPITKGKGDGATSPTSASASAPPEKGTSDHAVVAAAAAITSVTVEGTAEGAEQATRDSQLVAKLRKQVKGGNYSAANAIVLGYSQYRTGVQVDPQVFLSNIHLLRLADTVDRSHGSRAANEDIAEIRTVLTRHLHDLESVFRFYASGSVHKSKSAQLTIGRDLFKQFVRDARVDREGLGLTSSSIDVVFLRCHMVPNQEALKELKDEKAERSKGGVEKFYDKDDESRQELNRSGFAEAIVRLSRQCYPKMTTAQGLAAVLNNAILRHAHRDYSQRFRATLEAVEMQRVLQRYMKQLNSIFRGYAVAKSEKDFYAMIMDEFVQLLEDCQLIDHFRLPHDKVKAVFLRCQHGDRGGINASYLVFIEFLEALVASILFRVPDPYMAPETKVEKAIINYVLPKANAKQRWKMAKSRIKAVDVFKLASSSAMVDQSYAPPEEEVFSQPFAVERMESEEAFSVLERPNMAASRQEMEGYVEDEHNV